MQNYKDVCAGEKSVWFEIQPNEGEKFLKWAKSLGCVWINGDEIDPKCEVDFFHFSINSEGRLSYVSMLAWVLKEQKYKSAPKYLFSEYVKGNKVKPKSYVMKSLST